MSALRQLQQDFQGYLLQPTTAGGMLEQVVGTPEAGPEQRLEVYADAYRLRLLEALGEAYPGLHTLLGDQQFEAAARAYIDAYPSRQPSIRWFGNHLAEFLGATDPYAEFPFLAEMAAFEWTQSLVFDAPEGDLVGVEDMAAIAPDAWAGMRLIRHPSVQRLDLEWNIPVVWQAIDQEQEPPAPERGEYPVGWVLWRADLRIHWRSLQVDEAWALDQTLAGADFAAICEGLCEWIDPQNVAPHAAGLIKRWLSDGLISRIRLQGLGHRFGRYPRRFPSSETLQEFG